MSGSLLASITRFELETAIGDLLGVVGAKDGEVFLHRGDATGDMMHIAPVVRCNARRAVLVVDTLDTAGKGKGIARDYVDSFRLPPQRVRYVETGFTSVKALFESLGTDDRGNVNLRILGGTTRLSSRLGFATHSVRDLILHGDRNAPGGSTRTAVKETLRGPKLSRDFFQEADSKDLAVHNHLVGKLKIPTDRHVLVLWGRRACEKTPPGAHLDQDHNTGLMSDLIERGLYRGWTVLLAGDFKPDEFPGMTSAAGGRRDKAIFLGKFWDDLPGGGNRAQQIRMFYVLWKAVKWGAAKRSLLHCGPRSGALDGYGLSGQPVLYIIGGNANDERMEEKIVKPFSAHKSLKYCFRSFRLKAPPRVEEGKGGWRDGLVDPKDSYGLLQAAARYLDFPFGD